MLIEERLLGCYLLIEERLLGCYNLLISMGLVTHTLKLVPLLPILQYLALYSVNDFYRMAWEWTVQVCLPRMEHVN